MSLLHKLWCAYIFVLFFKLMYTFNIFVYKAQDPDSFSFTDAQRVILLLNAILKFTEIAYVKEQVLPVEHI